jgi:uncharacterized RDD family membrane protein YckC
VEIYLCRDGERRGPYSLEEVNRQLAAGIIAPHDLGWSETSPGWKPLLSFVGVIMPGGASSTPVLIGMAKPVKFGLPECAGFWMRALAHMIDAIVLGIFALVIAMWFKRPPEEGIGPSALGAILLLTMILIYMPALWASPMHATAGQRLCGLKVIPAVGGKMSFPRGVVRVLGMILSGAIFGIGYFMAAFTERKRALHDIIAGTYVVKDSSIGRDTGYG